jgi:hypothetical protein
MAAPDKPSAMAELARIKRFKVHSPVGSSCRRDRR